MCSIRFGLTKSYKVRDFVTNKRAGALVRVVCDRNSAVNAYVVMIFFDDSRIKLTAT